jgi:hypothetical protein
VSNQPWVTVALPLFPYIAGACAHPAVFRPILARFEPCSGRGCLNQYVSEHKLDLIVLRCQMAQPTTVVTYVAGKGQRTEGSYPQTTALKRNRENSGNSGSGATRERHAEPTSGTLTSSEKSRSLV